MGRDLIIYLRFLRYQATVFFVILICNWSVLIPLYYSGTYAEKNYLNLEAIQLKEKVGAGEQGVVDQESARVLD